MQLGLRAVNSYLWYIRAVLFLRGWGYAPDDGCCASAATAQRCVMHAVQLLRDIRAVLGQLQAMLHAISLPFHFTLFSAC